MKPKPYTRIYIHGDINIKGCNIAIADRGATATANSGNGNNAGGDNFKARAIDAILDLDIPADAKQAVLRTLNKL